MTDLQYREGTFVHTVPSFIFSAMLLAAFGARARSMRIFGTVFVICLLACGGHSASAQSFCPFLAFCDPQQNHCTRNCGALTDVIEWPQRQAFVERCSAKCDVRYSRCTARSARRCLNWR
jgi:hypothetical protein